MEGQRGVEMIRLAREEEVYDREAVLGRDATSVFPTEAKTMASSGMDALREAIGVKKFISESELESIKASRGASVEDGTVAADKSLAQVLAEARQKKDDDFQDKWKTMKQGKNRPLDDDEVEFLQQVADAEAERLRQQREEEEGELDAFRMAIRTAQAVSADEEPAEAGPQSRASASMELGQQTQQHPSSTASASGRTALIVKPLLSVKPSVIKVKPKQAAASTTATGAAGKQGAGNAASQQQQQHKRQLAPEPAASSQSHKRQHTAEAAAATGSTAAAQQQQQHEGAGEGDALALLLGAYGSDSDDAAND